jgi:hypothetical protein
MEERIKLALLEESWQKILEDISKNLSIFDDDFLKLYKLLKNQLDLCIEQQKTDVDDLMDPRQLNLF